MGNLANNNFNLKTSKKKFYCLDMFPYPSGKGLHVGHWKGYIFSDIYARMKQLQGYEVLHPMGWDAFGLPAENDAIKRKMMPQESTAANIANFKKQLEQTGAIYDWSREVNTSDPAYYKWTQWIFLKMFKAGLAYEEMMPVNWCPQCKTGLANEESTGGVCERCGASVEQRPLRQWVLRITKYADRLYDDLDKLDWPERVKLMQRNWIGRSEGALIDFALGSSSLTVFTTRPDTLPGVTFVVMAPDHDEVSKVIAKEYADQVTAYQEQVRHMSEMDRQLNKEKTGVFTGSYVINPLNEEKVPVYLSAYVLKHYGTGIIMGVPAHDQRDFEFAQKFGLEIRQVIKPELDHPEHFHTDGTLKEAVVENGAMIRAGIFDGMLAMPEAGNAIIEHLVKARAAKRHTCYKLRDWVFSRQRYWGEPIPLVHCPKCGIVPVPEDQLPVTLPVVKEYEPTGTGESPLAAVDSWVNTTCPACNGAAKRETNTMPQWAGSCWYFLRYASPHDNDHPFDPEAIKKWLPVDLYVGGIEHAVLHLLYARFYVKFLHDAGYLPFDEPFTRLFNQGMVCMYSTTSGRIEKMSKSKGNVVNPDDIVAQYNTDTLRMYELFMGPPELDNEWQPDSIKGVFNFLNRFKSYFEGNLLAEGQSPLPVKKRVHQFLKEYQKRLETYRVNTAVSAVMELMNDLAAMGGKLDRELAQSILTVTSVMVPFVATELLELRLNVKLSDCVWPVYDEALAAINEVELAIQVNGKLRGSIMVSPTATIEQVQPTAEREIAKWISDNEVVRVVFVPGRLINFVIKGI